MAYQPLDISKPTTAQTRQAAIDDIRENVQAMRDMLATGGLLQGFAYSAAGGSAEQPAQLFQKRGSEWLRTDLTWGSSGGSDGNVIKAAYYYSSNSGGAYDPMADSDGNYVCTLAYDASGNLSTTTWGATP